MKIVFVTTQSASGSTLIGRTIPVAKHLARKHDVHLLTFTPPPVMASVTCHPVGDNPFVRTPSGKKRLRGLPLLTNLFFSAVTICRQLWRLNPDIVVLVKTLPHNTLGVRLWQLFHPRCRIIIDADDFELTANRVTSWWQRAAIHWAQRSAADLADHIITASPFLSDYYSNLRPSAPVTMIPTGVYSQPIPNYTTQPVIAYLGSTSISSGHRVDFLPRILARLIKQYPHVRLIIAGNGDDDSAIKHALAKLHLSSLVSWPGRFNPADLPSLLNQIAIIIDPVDASVANRAKSSFRVALAVSTGLPVVTSNIGIRPWLIPSALHSRFFADPNPSSLAKQIIYLLSHPLTPTERQAMIKHARQYTWPKLARHYQSIIEA